MGIHSQIPPTLLSRLQVIHNKMCIKTVEVDMYDCHKWIAVGDIVLDFPLKDYNQYFFNDLYIVGSSGNDDGVFCVYRPRRNGVGEWSRADMIGYIYDYGELLNFINLRAHFINLKTDKKIKVNGEMKQKVFIFFPSHSPEKMAVTCLYLKHHDHRYGVTNYVAF